MAVSKQMPRRPCRRARDHLSRFLERAADARALPRPVSSSVTTDVRNGGMHHIEAPRDLIDRSGQSRTEVRAGCSTTA